MREEVSAMYISEVMKELNMSKKSIEVYEAKGLLTPHKDQSGYRTYDSEHIKVLKQIQMLRKMDFSLEEIKEIICLKNYAIFDAKIKQLEKEELRIKTIIQYYDDIRYAMQNDCELEEVKADLFSTLAIVDDDTIEEQAQKQIEKTKKFNLKMISNVFLIVLFIDLFLYAFHFIDSSIFYDVFILSGIISVGLQMPLVQNWIWANFFKSKQDCD